MCVTTDVGGTIDTAVLRLVDRELFILLNIVSCPQNVSVSSRFAVWTCRTDQRPGSRLKPPPPLRYRAARSKAITGQRSRDTVRVPVGQWRTSNSGKGWVCCRGNAAPSRRFVAAQPETRRAK